MGTGSGRSARGAALVALAVPVLVALGGCFGGGGQPAQQLPDDLSGVTQDLTTSATAGAISGEVLAESGAPVPGALVTISLQGVDDTADATTADEGVFYVGNLFPGDYHVVVSHIDYEPAETTVTVVADRIATASITLQEQP